MSVPCDEIRPELETLLAALTERALDGDGRRRLSALLRDHPEARQVYLDHCQMHALLHSAHGTLRALERPSRRRLRLAAAAAGILLAVAATLVLLDRRPLVRGLATSGDAWIIRDGRRLPLDRPRAGDRLVTGAGATSEAVLADGTRLRLRERTETEFRPDRIDLREGALLCSVAPQSRPLAFSTPHAEAAVLGTEFELSATGGETRLRTASGRVRLSAGARSVEVGPGEEAAADARGLVRWTPVCDLDFLKARSLPASLDVVRCPSPLLHTPARTVSPAPEQARLSGGGLVLEPRAGNEHNLVVARWTEEVGDDVVLEAEVAGGQRWSLGFSVSGDSFEGVRVIFAVLGYPEGISVDTIHPVDCVVLASDPRPISYDRDHVLRVEKRGTRLRVWVDGLPRIDTELAHALPDARRRTFAISNFGAPPVVRRLRAWKAAP